MSNTNDTIIPLIAGGTFTGTFQKRDVNSIASVNVFSDTTCDVRIQQAPNTTNVVNNDLFLYDPSSAVIVQQYLVLDYFRVVVTNTSGVDQTFLRITTKLSNVLEPVGANINVNLSPTTDGVLTYGASGGDTATPVAVWVDASGLIQDVNSAANTAVLANLDGCISANKVAVDIGAVDISGQTVAVSNFAELVTDLSGQFVHVDNFPASQAVTVSGCPPVQMLGSLTQTNAFYLDNVVSGIIASISVLDGYTTIELDSDPGFTYGQTIILTSVTALPQLSGRVYQIYATFSGPTTQNLTMYTPDLANLAVTAATGVVQSVRVSPLVCNEFSGLLVDISGQDVHVNNFADLVTDLSGQFVHVDNFPATQPVSGSVSLLAAADPTLCVGTVRLTDVYGQPIVTTAGLLMTTIAGINTNAPLHTIVDSATGTTLAYSNIALSNTGQVVSAVAATIRQFSAQNSNATNQYIKIYNKATAATTADTPIFTFLLPTNSGVSYELNHLFSVGISVRATFLPAVADNTAAADYVFTNLTYSV